MSLFDGLGPVVRSIEHIGSTAVPGIRAKPVIDILVTGATGFLGGHPVEEMVKGPHAPVCAHRKGSDTEKIDALGVEKTVFDLTDLDPMLQALKGVHAVVHLTAYYTFTGEKEMHDRVNVKGTGDLPEACREAGFERFQYRSSTEAMGPMASRQGTRDRRSTPSTGTGAPRPGRRGW